MKKETSHWTMIETFVQLLENIPESGWKRGQVIKAFLINDKKSITLAETKNRRKVYVINPEQCFYPQKIGETITIEGKKLYLAGAKNGTPCFKPV